MGRAAICGWLGFGSICAGQQATPTGIDAPAQEQVSRLLQKVIDTYWNNGEAKILGETNAPGMETNVEAAFRAASNLMPNRMDLRFDVASTLVGQAGQTNGAQLRLKIGEALEVYRQIQEMDSNGFDAGLLRAAYERALGETNVSSLGISRLAVRDPERTRVCQAMFERLDRVLMIQPSEVPDSGAIQGRKHVIIVLGAGLETNGAAKPKMNGRLEQCLRLAKLYSGAPIILTGGNPRGGVTEAYTMRLWCLSNHIGAERLWMEDESKDTVENALFTAALVKKLGAEEVTVVTSASHLRRGVADLQEACLQQGMEVRFHHLAAKVKGDTDLDPIQERLGVYRDGLRLSGYWAYPGLRR